MLDLCVTKQKFNEAKSHPNYHKFPSLSNDINPDGFYLPDELTQESLTSLLIQSWAWNADLTLYQAPGKPILIARQWHLSVNTAVIIKWLARVSQSLK